MSGDGNCIGPNGPQGRGAKFILPIPTTVVYWLSIPVEHFVPLLGRRRTLASLFTDFEVDGDTPNQGGGVFSSRCDGQWSFPRQPRLPGRPLWKCW